MRQRIVIAMSSIGILVSALFCAPSATAATVHCPNVHSKSSTHTVVVSSIVGCAAQARIDRYHGSTVIAVTGPFRPYGQESLVQDARGVNAGNGYRFDRLGTIGSWYWF